MTFSIRRGGIVQTIITAESYEAAAERYARSQFGKVTAQRTTGTRGLSGWFRAYRYDSKFNGLNSVGDPFHVL